jgi:dihydrofolate reductase
MAENGVIGANGRLPWHLPADLRHFREITMDKPLLMGRRTHDSIGRPLPGRHNIVLSRDGGYRAAGCTVVNSLDAAIEAAAPADEIMVMGGAQLYALLLPLARRMYLTEVHARVEGDTFFPPFDRGAWLEIERADFDADARHAYRYSFVVLERMDSDL